MKRYRPIVGEIIRYFERDDFENRERLKVLANGVEEDPNGEFVRFSDHIYEMEKLKAEIRAENPIYQLEEKLNSGLRLLQDGKCVECGMPVRDYKIPFGSFAPEFFATQRERGLNPSTGHKRSCSLGTGTI